MNFFEALIIVVSVVTIILSIALIIISAFMQSVGIVRNAAVSLVTACLLLANMLSRFI